MAASSSRVPAISYAIDAEEPHAGWPIDDEGWSLRTLYVDAGRLRAIAGEEAASPPALAGPIIRDRALISLYGGVHACSEAAGPALKRDERYAQFIARLLARHTRTPRRAAAAGREDRAVCRARDFLDHHLGEKVRLAEIAAAAGLPPFRLFRAFERATGMTPHGYQRQARIRFAAGLISQRSSAWRRCCGLRLRRSGASHPQLPQESRCDAGNLW